MGLTDIGNSDDPGVLKNKFGLALQLQRIARLQAIGQRYCQHPFVVDTDPYLIGLNIPGSDGLPALAEILSSCLCLLDERGFAFRAQVDLPIGDIFKHQIVMQVPDHARNIEIIVGLDVVFDLLFLLRLYHAVY